MKPPTASELAAMAKRASTPERLAHYRTKIGSVLFYGVWAEGGLDDTTPETLTEGAMIASGGGPLMGIPFRIVLTAENAVTPYSMTRALVLGVIDRLTAEIDAVTPGWAAKRILRAELRDELDTLDAEERAA